MFRDGAFVRIGVELRGASSVSTMVGRLRVLEYSLRPFKRLTIAKECIQEKKHQYHCSSSFDGWGIDKYRECGALSIDGSSNSVFSMP